MGNVPVGVGSMGIPMEPAHYLVPKDQAAAEMLPFMKEGEWIHPALVSVRGAWDIVVLGGKPRTTMEEEVAEDIRLLRK